MHPDAYEHAAAMNLPTDRGARQTAAPAHAAPAAADAVVIRRVETLAEYDECVRIERETWGETFTEVVSATVLRISQEMGGVTAAAFAPDGAMLGFVFGITGVRNGELAHWSDMLAVRPAAQGLGIGKRLKHFQREQLLPLGVRRMYWTYDPLVARNAHLNIERLGARAAEYRVNFYGEDTGSVVHAGLGTDRFIVEWDFETAAPLETPQAYGAPIANPLEGDVPVKILLPDEPSVRILVPPDIFAVLGAAPEIARAWRSTTRRAFEWYLARGWSVAGFRRDDKSGFPAYILTNPSRAHS
jgi:predicted GNAT superfamily acetyltransferase